MATILKHWREAATLVLVAKSKSKILSALQNATTSKITQPEKSLFNYEILMLRRSTKSTFMPNLYVFPGGTADNADFSSEWLDIFRNVCDTNRLFEFVKTGGEGPYMFSRSRPEEFEHIPSELAFRICAIRETFEESGVLLVRDSKRAKSASSNESDETLGSVAKLDENVTMEWRKRVDKDPKEFIVMCKELNVVPDVWSLYEWSNWLTPVVTKAGNTTRGRRRYDTAFYICVLDHVPDAVQDNKETVHAQWSSPGELIGTYVRSEGGLAPPQVYELSRLLNFQDADKLHRFSVERTSHRVTRWFPVPVFCSDGYIVAYPGDDLYPKNPEFSDDSPLQQYDGTVAEAASRCQHRNRIEHSLPPSADKDGTLNCNITMSDGQVAPLTDLKFLGLVRAKL